MIGRCDQIVSDIDGEVEQSVSPTTVRQANDEAFTSVRALCQQARNAVWLVAPAGFIVAESPTAQAICARGIFLRSENGHLVARRREEAELLQDSLRASVAGAGTRLLVMRSRQGHPKLVLKLRHVDEVDAILIAAVDLITPEQPDPALLMLVFQFTAAETRVAMALANHAKIGQIALDTGTTVTTVRSHIRSIFDKAAVRSQSDLNAMLQRTASLHNDIILGR